MEVVKYLFEHGGKEFLNQADEISRPPLFYACYRLNGALEAVEYLISQDVQISLNDKDKMGRTVLHYAVVTHNVDLVAKIVEINKHLLDEVDNDDWTPVHWAMRNAYWPKPNTDAWTSSTVVKDDLVKVVEVLLDGGSQSLSKIGGASGREWTPFKFARYHGVYEMVKDKPTLPTEIDNDKSMESLQLNESLVAEFHHRVCDACFCETRGIYYSCTDKMCFEDIDLCFKCIAYKDCFHDASHQFQKLGPEFEDLNQNDFLEPIVVEEVDTWESYINMDDL